MRKYLLLFTALLFFSFSSQAQFKKLIKKAKHKAIEAVLGDDLSDSTASSSPPQNNPPEDADDQDPSVDKEEKEDTETPPMPKPIDFPVTGETVHAAQGIYEWIIDTAAIVSKIAQTEQGKYAFELAREKGLKGNNEQLFQQMMDPKNREMMEEIEAEVEAKFPEKKTPKGFQEKEWQNSAWAGQAIIPSENPDPSNNPAWGGVSMPSLYFSAWGGDFNTWITDRYIKSELRTLHDGRPTIMGALGLQAAQIMDLKNNMTYSIGSVLGIQFTKVSHFDMQNDSAKFRILHTMGVAQKFWPVPGIKVEPGTVGKFGPYHTVSEKLIIPVRPFIDPSTGKETNTLLVYHDALSGREDAGPDPHHNHYDPSYKIIYEYYFTHDLDKELPQGLMERYKAAGFGDKGFCIGAKISDEKGNSADYRLTHFQPDVRLDKGQFQVPEDYPVMTDEELKAAVKKQFSLKNLFKNAIKNAGSEND